MNGKCTPNQGYSIIRCCLLLCVCGVESCAICEYSREAISYSNIIRFHLQDWDQVSAYSGRSIPRPRMYPIESQSIADDMRSHVSHFSGVVGKVGKARYSSGLNHRRNEINLINFLSRSQVDCWRSIATQFLESFASWLFEFSISKQFSEF